MSANETVRLLIIHDSREEAERLISMLNNAGLATRSQHVENEEALTKLLQEQNWDLLIAHEEATSVTPLTAIRQIQRLNQDVATIIQTDVEGNQPVVEGLKIGACDVVRTDEDQHLLLVIQRELDNHQQRRLKRRADRKLQEAERRSQQLLNSSRNAIAFVQEGLFLYANQSFAERFGYSDRDDIECMPVIDMVADEDQSKVKQFLKEFSLKGDDAEMSQLSFSAIQEDGSSQLLNVETANAIYDEEPCIEFIIHADTADNEELQAELQKIKDQDVTTGLFNRQYILDSIQQQVIKLAESTDASALFYIEIDHFESQVQAQMGVSGSEGVLVDIGQKIKEHCADHDVLARFSDETFMWLSPGLRAETAIKQAEKLCENIRQHVVDIDGTTIQTTVSIGMSLITGHSSNADEVVSQAMAAHEKLRAEIPDGNSHKLFEPERSVEEQESHDITKAVQAALDKNRFNLLFQPIISLRGAEDEHYEVLLRMLDDEGEQISPNQFLSSAADIGATTKIDRWVILESIKLLSEHRSKGNKTRMLINLSAESMADESLAPWLKVAFNAAKVPPDSIIFQLSEADITRQLNIAKTFLSDLQTLGCQTSISNFGCSLNPFKTLEHVSCEHVKIDGSFTQDIQDNNENPETLSNLIKELMSLNKITIVPFVENANVLSTLWQTGVHYIQGYYVQAPTSSMDFDFNMEG